MRYSVWSSWNKLLLSMFWFVRFKFLYILQEKKNEKPVTAAMLNRFKCDILIKAYKVACVLYLLLASLIRK